MGCSIDSISLDLLQRTLGMRLERVLALRYPGYLAYSQVVATFAGGFSIQVDLTEVTIAPKFEAFVARVRPIEPPQESEDWDRLAFGDFAIANTFILRREEWLNELSKSPAGIQGGHAIEQRFGDPVEATGGHERLLVDSGICFISARGAELSFDADSFPLVLQMHYEVSSSPMPKGMRIATVQYNARQ